MARKPPPQPTVEDQAEAYLAHVAAEGLPDSAVEIDPADEVEEPRREHDISIVEMYTAHANAYDPQAAHDLVHRLFPHGTITALERLTGVAVRIAARWSKGESRIPPTLWKKLEDQDAKRLAFEADLRDLVSRHIDAGLTRSVCRQVLLSSPEDDSLKIPEQL